MTPSTLVRVLRVVTMPAWTATAPHKAFSIACRSLQAAQGGVCALFQPPCCAYKGLVQNEPTSPYLGYVQHLLLHCLVDHGPVRLLDALKLINAAQPPVSQHQGARLQAPRTTLLHGRHSQASPCRRRCGKYPSSVCCKRLYRAFYSQPAPRRALATGQPMAWGMLTAARGVVTPSPAGRDHTCRHPPSPVVPLPVVTTERGATLAANFMTCATSGSSVSWCQCPDPAPAGANKHTTMIHQQHLGLATLTRRRHPALAPALFLTCDLPVPGSPMSSMWHSPRMCVPESSRLAQPPMRVMATASFTRNKPYI